MIMKKLVLAFGILFFLFSCEKNDLIYPENINDQDLVLKSGNPDQPNENSAVSRFQADNLWMALYDASTNLTAFIGVNIRQHFYPGGGVDVIDIQQILQKNGNGSRLLVNQDDVTVQVWEGYIFNNFAKVFWADPIYSGTGHLVYTQNDNLSSPKEDNYLSIYGLRLTGDGIKIKYQYTWQGNNPSDIEQRVNIVLK
jgi:hypothetical protein